MLDVGSIAPCVQFDRLPIARMLAENAQRCAARPARALATRFLGLELETDLAVRLLDEVRGEGPARPGRHELQQVGLSRLEQLRHLRAIDGSLQDHPAGTEVARATFAHGSLAYVRIGRLEHAIAAFRTRAERYLTREVDVGVIVVEARAEVELDLIRIG